MRPTYFARRLRFQNGERTSTVIRRDTGMPVHSIVLYLDTYRLQGLKADTIHAAACSLALLFRHLDHHGIDLPARLLARQFLTKSELDRLADLAQLHVKDLATEDSSPRRVRHASKVRTMDRIRMENSKAKPRRTVVLHTRATRLRHFGGFLQFLGEYCAERLSDPADQDQQSKRVARGVEALLAMVPKERGLAKLGARQGLDAEQQALMLATVHPDSPTNPWKNPFVRTRNYLIVVLFLAAGLRRGELAGLEVGDIGTARPIVTVYRRADNDRDLRVHQPVAKTADREIPLDVAILRRLREYVQGRHTLKAARKLAQLFVTDDGKRALSYDAIGKIFKDIRRACEDLPGLSAHVLRHTFNDRFSEAAEAMGLTEGKEEKARSVVNGWKAGSGTAATYTKRTIERRANAATRRLQEQLEQEGKK